MIRNNCIFLSLTFLLLLMSTPSGAQVTKGNIYDSSVIPAKRMPQQQEFWNNAYNFPAKPRNQWEVGGSFGMVSINGDIPSLLPTFGFGLHVRKAFGYLFSLRLEYLNGTAKGLMWQSPLVNTKNPAWLDNSVAGVKGNLPLGKGYNALYRDENGNLRGLSPTLNGGLPQRIFNNYKTHLQDLSLQGIITLNNVRFHKQKTNFTFYGGAGLGFTAYHVMVNALNAGGNNYTDFFNNVNVPNNGNDLTRSEKREVRKKLKDGMDKTYETEAESEKKVRGGLGKNTLMPMATGIVGISYRLSKTINIALEERHTLIKSDLLDGQRWQVQPVGDVALTKDKDSYNYLSLGLNFNVGAKATEPLWWLNPLDYAYDEINNPKHMKLPKPVFDDMDGDGVTDQFDREPNTPAGCPVDTHGVTKDTDGDGVPDCRDKQLITPTDCQPVDADGVGKCPEPGCCAAIKAQLDSMVVSCPNDYPSIRLKKAQLDNDSRALLDAIAAKLKEHPTCSLNISAYPKADKRMQALAQKKMELVKTYLVEKAGISADRILTNLVIEGGDADTLDFK